MAKKGEFKNLAGMQFSRWHVDELAFASYRDECGLQHHTTWFCTCACGTKKAVVAMSLVSGDSRSCGCFANEVRGVATIKHGMRRSAEYRVWSSIKSRTTNRKNKSFNDYGARGITMCDEWLYDFSAFFAHVGVRPSAEHSLERRDNDRGYEPGNVEWATKTAQANNTRANRFVEIEGLIRTLAQWCKEHGRNYKTVHARITKGWSEIEAILTPTDEGRKTRKVA